ncbi:peptidase M23 [Nitrincola tapanii]|uniref:Peptidase M23 n=2 Tax=Nitrincola tapanii TaxID=1708751 RepID=A0A5A9W3F1_9GAMM|nr:peptidase M23 [Nitrincola tapanii]
MQLNLPQNTKNRLQGLPVMHLGALAVVTAITLTALLWPESSHDEQSAWTASELLDHSALIRDEDLQHDFFNHNLFLDESEFLASLNARQAEPGVFHYSIQQGDTLSTIFDKAAVGQTIMHQILAADEQLLALDILRPGNHLTFRKDVETGHLEEMELYIHAGNRVIYRRVDENNFEFEEKLIPGSWEQQIVSGEIYGSFYVSAIRAGLSKSEILEVNKLMGEQIDFNRHIRAGDRFQVIRKAQFVETEATGQSQIQAIRLQQNNRAYTAFLFEDGNYYDAKGESLTRAFRRLPHDQNYRISSPFNPRRLHPVTRRVSPHNGTDFAMPIGTPVVSIGDGVVTRVENHPFAGRYIEIQHGSTYKTRYLHLHRQLVKRGDTVKRGERIALSGNTGRSTGPHLHFELHVNGRPVNAMTASLPLAKSVPREQLAKFNEQVNQLVSIMDTASQEQIAQRQDANQPGS